MQKLATLKFQQANKNKDLEESPPPQDNTEPGSEAAGDTPEVAPETEEVIQNRLMWRPA